MTLSASNAHGKGTATLTLKVSGFPTLTAPASNSFSGNPVSVAFTLPEAAKAGSVKLTFHAGSSRMC